MIEGRAWKFGDHIDTDLIIPARYLNVSDEKELANHCFIDLRPDFVREVKPGDIIVAGENFGCGSSREHAPLAIKSAGISVIIAKSFARIFYRNAFNIGLPILESEEASSSLEEGAYVGVDLASGKITVKDTGETFLANPVPEFMREIVDSGGLAEYIKKRKRFRH